MLPKLTIEIYNLIAQQNFRDTLDAIPHSDQFIREVSSLLTLDPATIIRSITILKESHKILTIEVIKEDKKNDIKRVEGYVDADLKIIRKLKTQFQNALMDEYEYKHNRRLLVHQIIKEIYSKISSFKNTPIGQLANKAIMLEEFEYLLEKNYKEYTDEWKANTLNEILKKTENVVTEKAGPSQEQLQDFQTKDITSESPAKRAIDSESVSELSSPISIQNLNKTIEIYGINFFFRVHLRKYNFNLLCEIIDNGLISNRNDLKILKDMIRTIKLHYATDPKLQEYKEELNRLDQMVTHHMVSERRK